MKIDGCLASILHRSIRILVGESVDFDAAKCESCRAYEKSRANASFSTCHKMCSCRFAWQAWHFVTFHVCEARDPREAEVAVPMGKVAQA